MESYWGGTEGIFWGKWDGIDEYIASCDIDSSIWLDISKLRQAVSVKLDAIRVEIDPADVARLAVRRLEYLRW